MNYTMFYLIMTLTITGCGAFRTDGYMNMNGQVRGMIYFDAKNPDALIKRMAADFGDYEAGKEDQFSITWSQVVKKDWSAEKLRIKLMRYPDVRKKGYFEICLAVVNESGQTLTEPGSEALAAIKRYLKTTIKD